MKSKFLIKIVACAICAFLVMSVVAPLVGSAITFDEVFGSDSESEVGGASFTDFKGGIKPLDDEATIQEYDSSLTGESDLKSYVIKVVNFALGFLGLLAVLIVIYGGVLYVTASGESEKGEKGKKAIAYAAIGLLIVMGSFAFVNTIIRSGGGEGGDGSDTSQIGGTAGVTTFNAAAQQVKSIAQEIYEGYVFLSETTEEIKNIVSDAQKVSLSPDMAGEDELTMEQWRTDDLPSKQEIQSYLNDFRQKLRNIKQRLTKFSEAETLINDILREVEREIDVVDGLNNMSWIRLKNGKVEYCDRSAAPDFDDTFEKDEKANAGAETYTEVTTWGEQFGKDGGGYANLKDWWCANYSGDKDEKGGGASKPDPVNNPYNYEYPENLWENWTSFRDDFIIDGGQLKNLAKKLGTNYSVELEDNTAQLEEIWDYVSVIEAVSTGQASVYKATMLTNFGYLLEKAKNWDIEIENLVSASGQNMMKGVEAASDLYDELDKIKFVNAKLSADVISGSAPLVVIFNTSRSADPAGGSITGDNITWDLDGTFTVESFQKGEGVTPTDPVTDAIDCEITETPEDTLGTTYMRCVYKRPGTYDAAVLIKSNDPTKYGPGISTLRIKVTPPTTKIDLKVTAGSDTEQVMKYDETGILLVDKDLLSVTLDDAKAGITFNAGATQDAKQYKWTYGDGTIDEFDSTNSAPVHKYKAAGRYVVTLKILNKLGNTDKKTFALEVGNLSARIKAIPESGAFINQPVVFDGGASKSDVGGIRQYTWTITSSNSADSDYPYTESGSSLKRITHTFKKTATYTIALEVVDNKNNVQEISISGYSLKSKPPVALFDYEIPKETQPSTLHFNASKTYDPDGENENLTYNWTIEAEDAENADQWSFVTSSGDYDPSGDSSKNPIIRFDKRGDYKVTLKVVDSSTAGPDEESGEITKDIEITDVLDIAWDPDMQVTKKLDDNGEAEFDFQFISENAVAFEINFGDGQSESDDISGSDTVSHSYIEAGDYLVTLTVYDEDDNDKSIKKKIFVGGGDQPIAKISAFINNVEVDDLEEPITVTRKDILKFDASDSVNMDGTAKLLKYSWDFGDSQKSSEKVATHVYKEVSGENGSYTISLKVSDRDDADKNDVDKIKVRVVSAPPSFSTIQALPKITSGQLITPVTVDLKAYGAEDPDGEIVQYRWWYFDSKNPEEALGVQITRTPNAQLVLGTLGKEGSKVTYGFGLEVTDTDNITFSSKDLFEGDNYPKLEVVNGKNELPLAKFNVDKAKVFTGEKVSFTSASKDPDGKIKQYVWDFEGDGFFNNAPTDKSAVEHIYKKKNLTGYAVRLKVIDDKGGEAVSQAINVYVDSNAKNPVAAFTIEPLPGTGGKGIKFINNSKADTAAGADIESYVWDFDTISKFAGADSDGDGDKTNDADSAELSPEWIYLQPGQYTVKLTVTDTNGTVDTVENMINVVFELPPAVVTNPASPGGQTTTGAAEKLTPVMVTTPEPASDGLVYLQGDEGSIIFDFSKSTGAITYYIFDKNIYFDTDGDGIKSNDQDFKTTLPGTWKTNFQKIWGKTIVKLTVKDIYGNEASTTQEIKFK